MTMPYIDLVTSVPGRARFQLKFLKLSASLSVVYRTVMVLFDFLTLRMLLLLAL